MPLHGTGTAARTLLAPGEGGGRRTPLGAGKTGDRFGRMTKGTPGHPLTGQGDRQRACESLRGRNQASRGRAAYEKRSPNTDYRALQEAKRLLERPGLTAQIAEAMGKPIEYGFRYLPDEWRERVAPGDKSSPHERAESCRVHPRRNEKAAVAKRFAQTPCCGIRCRERCPGHPRASSRTACFHLPHAPFHCRHRPKRRARRQAA